MKRTILALCLVLSLSAETWALTRYVDDNAAGCVSGGTNYSPTANGGVGGCPGGTSTIYTTLAAAIATTGAGEFVYVRSGIYPVTLVIVGKNGSSGLPITIMGYPGDTPPIIRPASTAYNSGTNRGFIISGSSYVTVSGFEFDGVNTFFDPTTPTAGGTIGSTIESSDHIIMEDNEIHNFRGVAILVGVGSHQGIILRRNHIHHQVTNCIPGNRFYAIYFSDGLNSIIEDNDAHDNPGGGFHIYNTSATPSDVTGLIVRGNKVYRNNTCASADAFGGVLIGPENTAHIFDNIQVYNNLIYKNNSSGTGGDGSGLTIYGRVSNLIIHSNTIYGNNTPDGFGILFTPDFGNSTGASPSPIIRNNLVTGNDGAAMNLSNASSPTVEKNACMSAEVCDSGAADRVIITNIDACVVNAATDDYHLKSGANPCADAGTSTGAPATDHDDVARPVSVGFDIGAYEFTDGSTPPLPPATPRFAPGINLRRASWQP